ncbi:MAG: carbohydrate kinase family protein [Acidobacteriota bacterium]
MTQPEVVVVGNVGIDTNAYLPIDSFDAADAASALAATRTGAEVTFADVRDCVGQAGGYSARGYARLGRSVAFIGHVGDDFSGRHVRAELAADGVDLRGLGTDPAGTARSVNLMSRAGMRRNVYDPKGHMQLTVDPESLRPLFAGARLAHVHLADWARHVLPVMREEGVVLAVDLQDVVDPDDAYRFDFVQAADILFASAANHPEPEPLIEHYLSGRAELVVVGMGARGCAVGTTDGIRRIPPPDLGAWADDHPVVDTNGAGDSLAVGLLVAHVLEGRPLDEPIRRGQIAARWACSLRSDSSRLITAAELDALTDP